MSQGSPDSGKEFGGAKGFGDIVICTGIQGIDFFFLLGTGGDDYDGKARPASDLLDDIQSCLLYTSSSARTLNALYTSCNSYIGGSRNFRAAL